MYGFNGLNDLNGYNNLNNPQYKIIHIRGKEGANALPMAPNSEALLLDDTAPLVWLAQVDGMGYKTLTPYDIAPHESVPEVSMSDLLERIERLESKLDEQSHNATVTKSYDKPGNKPQSTVSASDKVR